MKNYLLFLAITAFGLNTVFAQSATVDFNAMDSLIETTAEIDLCIKDGKEDIRFFTKTPEKYSDYKQIFATRASSFFSFGIKSHFFCDVTAEINCKGQAGNYRFAIEPRTFTTQDFEAFKQLIIFVNSLTDYTFIPAHYLGENVNSKVRFRLSAKDGKPTIQ